MSDNNLFQHARKELALDAFLCWLFNEIGQNKKFYDLRESLLTDFCEIEEKRLSNISEIKAETQVDHIDLVVCFTENGAMWKIIFENKTWGMAHSNQLRRYIKKYKQAEKHIFLKLAHVNSRDKELVSETEINGDSKKFEIKEGFQLLSLLSVHVNKHIFIKQFCEYLDSEFLSPEKLKRKVDKNEFKELKKHSLQQYVMDRIYKDIKESKINNLRYKVGVNNDGSPWTQLDFHRQEYLYNDKHEYIFFRIDKRKGGQYYFRINQYAGIGNSYKEKKQKNLEILRLVGETTLEEFNFKPGKVHNKGVKESEVLILFFNDNENTLKKVYDQGAKLATVFLNKMKSSEYPIT